MKNKKPFHSMLVLGAALFGILLLCGCSEETSMQSAYGSGEAAAGAYANVTPQADAVSVPQPQMEAPQAANTDSDHSYINRTTSGITVGGDGNGNVYVNDRETGSSVANDGN